MNGRLIRPFRKKSDLNDLGENRNGGFSLVELLVVIAIISIMLAALVGLFSSLSKSYTTEEVRAEAQQNLRSAGDLMIRDIRMAGLDTTLSGNFGILIAEDQEIRFTMDNDSSGFVEAGNFEDTAYKVDGSVLRQSLDGGAFQPVIENVAIPNPGNPNFIYLDEDDNPMVTPVTGTTNLSSIRTVLIQNLAVEPPAGQKVTLSAAKGEVSVMNVRIQCRNLWF